MFVFFFFGHFLGILVSYLLQCSCFFFHGWYLETSDESILIAIFPCGIFQVESRSPSRQVRKGIISTLPILRHLGLPGAMSSSSNGNKLVKSRQHGTSDKDKGTSRIENLCNFNLIDPDYGAESPSTLASHASGTKVKNTTAKSQSQADEKFEETVKSISEEGDYSSPVTIVTKGLSEGKGCSLQNVVDNVDESSAPSSFRKCRQAQAKRSIMKNANVESPCGRTKYDFTSWRNECDILNEETTNFNGQLQHPQTIENDSSRECEMVGLMAVYTDLQNDHSLPASFGKKKALHITKLKPGPAKLTHGFASSKQKPNRYENSGTLSPFDICESEREFCTSTAVTFAKDEEQESEMCQPDYENNSRVLRPGMVLLKGYLTLDEQVSVVRECRNLGLGPGGFYQPGYKYGAKLRLRMMCLGRDWDPETRKYSNRRRLDNSQPPDIPHRFLDMVSEAMADSQTLTEKEYEYNNVADILPTMLPDICIVNFYSTTGRLGLHQDRDESRESLAKGLPVVSISVGDSAEFLYGDERDISKADKLVLDSGDVLIFGGESRHVFHGVESIIPGSAPHPLLEETRLRPGRLNLTFRQF
ncbi:hypothetical protein V2J09_010728 [Rumex salicifolius]